MAKYRAMRLSPPTGSARKIYVIKNMLGVDFNDPLNVDEGRSPDAINYIAREVGTVETRKGRETRYTFEGRINGLFSLKTVDGEKLLCHHGTKLSLWDGTELYSGLKDDRSKGWQMGQKFWILDGQAFLVYDGETVKTVESVAYTPTTVIARAPSGGGESFEPINLLQKQRKNEFLGTATDKVYQLDASGLDETPVSVKKMKSDGEWEDLAETTHFTVDRATGKVTFTTAPGVSPVTGESNIIILFAKTQESYVGKINKCSIFTLYGVNGAADRAIIAGNPDTPNCDYYCQINDPTYFADLWYAAVGQENTEIMGYSRMGNGTLAIHKSRNGQDPTVFYRVGELAGDGGAVFRISQGANGVGVISKHAMANLVNDPLALSTQGVFATVPVANIAGNERYAQQRSYYVNPRLTQEPNLKEAVAIEFGGFYYLAVNDHVYIADSRQRSYAKGSQSEQYQYEWYFWHDFPVRVWKEYDDTLYWGTDDGRICAFKDSGTIQDYSDDDGAPYLKRWTLPIFTGTTFFKNKTIESIAATFQPYSLSSAIIYVKTDGIWEEVEHYQGELRYFSWMNLVWSKLNWSNDTTAKTIASKMRYKNIDKAQVKIENTEANEGIGILRVAIEYTESDRNVR